MKDGLRKEEREKWYLSVDECCQCHCVRVLQLDVMCEGVYDLIIGVDFIVVEKRQELVFTEAEKRGYLLNNQS